MSEDGAQLPPGQEGEILVGGPTVISGYLDAPELNRASFSNGWFKTGDIGSLDEDGFLTLHGRKDDLINRGEKISPSEIDQALMRHPAVAEAAAFSIPHHASERMLLQRLCSALAQWQLPRTSQIPPGSARSFKIPQRIIVRDQLPKGETG